VNWADFSAPHFVLARASLTGEDLAMKYLQTDVLNATLAVLTAAFILVSLSHLMLFR